MFYNSYVRKRQKPLYNNVKERRIIMAELMNLAPASVEKRDIYDDRGNLIMVAEDKTWEFGDFSLLISEFEEDSKLRFVKIVNNSGFNVDMSVEFSLDNANVFDEITFSLPSNLADNASDVRKLGDVLKNMADAHDYFSAVLSAEFPA